MHHFHDGGLLASITKLNGCRVVVSTEPDMPVQLSHVESINSRSSQYLARNGNYQKVRITSTVLLVLPQKIWLKLQPQPPFGFYTFQHNRARLGSAMLSGPCRFNVQRSLVSCKRELDTSSLTDRWYTAIESGGGERWMSFDKTAAESESIIGTRFFDGLQVWFHIDRLDLVLRVWNVQRLLYSTLHYFILFGCESHTSNSNSRTVAI